MFRGLGLAQEVPSCVLIPPLAIPIFLGWGALPLVEGVIYSNRRQKCPVFLSERQGLGGVHEEQGQPARSQ